MSEDPMDREDLQDLRRRYGNDPKVLHLVDQLEATRRVLTDVTAFLETAQMSWRGEEPDERYHQELRDLIDRLVTQLHAFQKGKEGQERDAARAAIAEIHQDFHQRGT